MSQLSQGTNLLTEAESEEIGRHSERSCSLTLMSTSSGQQLFDENDPWKEPLPPKEPEKVHIKIPKCAGCRLGEGGIRDQNGVAPFHVVSMKLRINGNTVSPMDERPLTQRNVMTKYIKFCRVLNLLGSIHSNGVDYFDFLTDSFFDAYDLTTSANSSLDQVFPQVREGIPRYTIEFSDSTSLPLRLICHYEYPSIMQVSKENKVALSYK